MRSTFGKSLVILPVILATLFGLTLSDRTAQAQGPDACPTLLNTSVEAIALACPDVPAGQACLGSAPVEITPAGDAGFSAPGDVISLEMIQTLTTSLNLEEGARGGAVLALQADLPAGAQGGITAILFGDTRVVNLVDPEAEAAPTIVLQNAAGYPVNLRGGGGTTYPTIGTLEEGVQIVADGRTEAGDWYRVMSSTGPAWVYRDLVSIVDGDSAALAVLSPDDITQAFVAPMQSMSLHTAASEAECGAGASGLLLQLHGEDIAHLRINGVDLSFAEATLFIQAPTEDSMQVLILDGQADIKANGRSIAAQTNNRIELILDGESAPLVHQAYEFASLEGTPVELLPAGMVCIAGLPQPEAEVMLFTGPGGDYSPLTAMQNDLHYTVIGQNQDEAGTPWWQVDITGYARAWVERDRVRTIGLCDAVAMAEPPRITVSSGGQVSGGLVPAGQSVWQTDPGLDSISGTCLQPPVALCAHLAAITRNPDGSITWRGQELTPYTLYPAGDNAYSYNGRNVLNSGNTSMMLQFVDANNWVMTMTTIFDNDPACTHTLNYTAARRW